MYHLFDARNVQYDDINSMIKDDKYSDKTKKNILQAKLEGRIFMNKIQKQYNDINHFVQE